MLGIASGGYLFFKYAFVEEITGLTRGLNPTPITEKVFSLTGLGLSLGVLLGGIAFYAIFSGIKRILEK